MLKIEWEGYLGSDTWEPIKDIVKHTKQDVISLLQNYNRK